jgi:hypothetical protein
MDRLNVRNLLKRKKENLEGNNYNCPLCSMGREETTFHLFFSYPFSQHCWNHLNINWNFNLDFYSMMLNAREQFGSNFFMEIFMIAAWLIWKQRNDLVFNRARPSFDRWQAAFMSEAQNQAHRMSVIQKRFIFIARFLVQIGFLFLLAVLVPSVGFYFFFYSVYFACPFYIYK